MCTPLIKQTYFCPNTFAHSENNSDIVEGVKVLYDVKMSTS